METQSEFFFCSGAATEVLKVGSSQLSGEEVLLLLIPGNPGVVGFYESFLLTLHGMLGRPVWAVSHAGHCAPPDSMDLVEDGAAAARRDVFGLDGQIQHKLAFIRDRVPRGTRLVLVGHSIGCYMILEMMRRSPELEVLKAVLLFPTIERMAQSPQGKVMTPVLCQLRYLAYLPLFLLSLLPQRVAALLVRLLLRGLPALDPCVLRPALQMFSGDCAVNSMYLGGQEMRMVQERDNVTIQKNLDRLIFYYGATDHWCPVSYFQDMRRDFPHGDIRLCERGVRHAFVLDAGQDVAQMVAAWIGGSLTA
ncbi:lipid droplet-associated hydrolase isoform X1 [Xiphophorus couchianus]|uniref:lipid droplet-associated hydrolase isoform X1 n=2 Tax=Xiphophorus couchianus TaxID=32473 RepID=UPI00101711C4|nr:lipid droplet-associated hydrolase isoform X1 [Xiphophorus couchianus]XP_027856786.1 lipid droplet-associated hydrolase isoform X1 [Xiphophorus couchianus]